MKYTVAKLIHAAIFLLFGGLCTWGAYVSASSDTTAGKVLAVGLLALTALGAKWAFVDGFPAVDRKRAYDNP